MSLETLYQLFQSNEIFTKTASFSKTNVDVSKMRNLVAKKLYDILSYYSKAYVNQVSLVQVTTAKIR